MKLRAWDKNKKIMHYNFEHISLDNDFDNPDRYVIINSDKARAFHPEHKSNKRFAKLSNFIIMHNTFMHDSNKDIIYEGDVFERDGHIGIVTKKIPSGKWVLQLDNNVLLSLYCDEKYRWSIEKATRLGNIYENPEYNYMEKYSNTNEIYLDITDSDIWKTIRVSTKLDEGGIFEYNNEKLKIVQVKVDVFGVPEGMHCIRI